MKDPLTSLIHCRLKPRRFDVDVRLSVVKHSSSQRGHLWVSPRPIAREQYVFVYGVPNYLPTQILLLLLNFLPWCFDIMKH